MQLSIRRRESSRATVISTSWATGFVARVYNPCRAFCDG